jgi:hypothetical protein
MMKKRFLILLVFSSIALFGQNGYLKQEAPNVYIDCKGCDMNYIRENIQFVNYVWDRKNADVHILVTKQRTGGGGKEWFLKFVGLNSFTGKGDTLKFFENETDTDDDLRKKLVRTLKLGLVRYASKTPVFKDLNISYDKPDSIESQTIEDPWNYWVFEVSLHSWMQSEKSYERMQFRGSIDADRVTKDWKIGINLNGRYSEDKYDYQDYKNTEFSKRQTFRTHVIKSISDHWSAGTWLYANSSTYNNIDYKVSAAPALEYNVFPYEDYNSRQLRIVYRIWSIYNNYIQETIYFKNEEYLLENNLYVTFEMIQPWGEAELTLSGSHFFHDFSKNSINLRGNFEVNLFKGFSMDFRGGISAVHNQITLPNIKANLEEVLLRRRELSTQYEYWASLGFSYSFGSIYNNIVNPRFGS